MQKRVEKLLAEGYNLKKLSDYAEKSLSKGSFDEVYTEYMTKLLLDGEEVVKKRCEVK